MTSPLSDPSRIARQKALALRNLDLFRASLRPDGHFAALDRDGTPKPGPQELIAISRLVHSYALGHIAGAPDCETIIDTGVRTLWRTLGDDLHGGYLAAVEGDGPVRSDKLAYGHAFVLLAASSAEAAGHPDAARLRQDVTGVLEDRFLDPARGLYEDEFRRDWTRFSQYRGMNANMHATEAHLAAFEITGDQRHLDRAQTILRFFVDEIAATRGWRLTEHYHPDWSVDESYEGDPMFRPAGTTPGHSVEFGRLLLQAWDLAGRPKDDSEAKARALIETALKDAWQPGGGMAYTLDFDGTVLRPDRLWWPVTEGIGAVASLLKLGGTASDREWYVRLWDSAEALFIDDTHGGWFPEAQGTEAKASLFEGKPDIYHALQAELLPLHDGLSGHYTGLKGVLGSE
ncbi:mannose-6-phosphate isomerase [Salipiger pallidus]|uniref:Mannose-6-phosphate isomerase n=1 Tax=Salipiger pallidus TaxID=1775170 RepID=A0A8J3EHE4_9RHOB|nr:AGE family epimerase/isomerase [Salipiger pallidus]GGG78102.1 mannose-6-phosphate isomerase [Salipiger pallidus]